MDIKFISQLDTSQLDAGINRSTKKVKDWTKEVEKHSHAADSTLAKVTRRMAAYATIWTGINLVKQVVELRGQFQQLQIAFETMLDSKEKADKLMQESIVLAQKAPFTLAEVATNTKQLLAMGVSFEKVMSTLKNLGDVAAGLSVPIQRIAINYGQVITLGRLQQREIRDFAMAGVPLIEELAKNLGKTTKEIYAMVSEGKIGAVDVEKAFQTMSSEGGKFFNLMEKQTASVTGQISVLVDQWQLMMNEIGQDREGVIYGAINLAKYLVKNYELVGKTLLGLIATYGAYKVAVALVTKLELIRRTTAIYDIATRELQIKATLKHTAAIMGLNKAMILNPYVAATVAIVAMTAAMAILLRSTDSAKEGQKQLNNILSQSKEKREDLINNTNSLINTIRSETSAVYEQVKAYKELVKNKFFSKYTIEEIRAMSEEEVQNLKSVFESEKSRLDIQSSYNKEFEKLTRLQSSYNKLKDTQGEPEAQAAITATKKGLEQQIEAQKIVVNGLQKEIDLQKELREEARIQSMSEADREKYYKAQIKRYQQEKDLILSNADVNDEALEKVNEKLLLYNKKLGTIIDDNRVKNKKYWEEEKKSAEDAINTIDAEILKKLKSGSTKGIAPETVRIFTAENKRLKEAEAMLLAYNRKEDSKNAKQQEKNDKEIAKQRIQLQFEIEQAIIDQMADGAARQREQADLDYRKRVQQIREQEKELLEKQGFLTAEDRSLFGEARKQARGVKQKTESDIIKEESEKIIEINRRINDFKLTGYEKELAELNRVFDQQQANATSQELWDKIEEERELKRQELKRRFDLESLDIEEQIAYLKNELAVQGYDREQKLIEANFNTWKATQLKRVALLRTGSPEEQLQAALIQQKILTEENYVNLEKELRIRNLIFESANKLVSTIRQYNSELADMLEQLVSASSLITKAFSKDGLTLEQAVGGAVDGVMSLLSTLITSTEQRKKAMKDFYDSVIKQQNDYNLALNENLRLNQELEGNVFYTDYEAKLKDASKAFKEAIAERNKYIAQLSKLNSKIGIGSKIDAKTVLGTTGAGAGAGAAIGSIIPGIGTAVGALIGGVVGLLTGLVAKKSKDITAPLLKVFPELIDANGKFNKTLAETLIANKQVTEETAKVLQNIIDWENAAEEARKQIVDIISEMTGQIGDDLRNALVQSFKDGTDAATAFGESVTKVLENILAQNLFSMIFGDALKQLQKEMEDSYLGEEADYNWMDDIRRFFEKTPAMMDAYNKYLEQIRKETEGSSLELFKRTGTGTQTTLAGQIRREITEDTGRELAGLYRRQSDDVRVVRDLTRQSVNHLVNIEKNTFDTVAQLQSAVVELKSINKNTKPVYSGL